MVLCETCAHSHTDHHGQLENFPSMSICVYNEATCEFSCMVFMFEGRQYTHFADNDFGPDT
jgi:hypothetical protein